MWRESTQKIFWGVMTIAIAGIFSTVYDYFSLAINAIDMAGRALPGGMGSSIHSVFSSIKTVGVLAKIAIIAGYVFYLLGLKEFAILQTDVAAKDNISKVRTAVIMMIVCYIVTVLLGWIVGLGLLVGLAVWIVTLVALVKMKNAFGGLMVSPVFSPMAQAGARQLRSAAVYNITLMLLPIAMLLFLVMAGVMLLGGKSGNLEGSLTLIGMIVGVTVIASVVMMILAFFYPLFGWKKIMDGGPAEGAQLQDPPVAPAAELHGQTAAPAYEEQVQAIQEKGTEMLSQAQDTLNKQWDNMQPQLSRANSWFASNKKGLAIGAAAGFVLVLFVWLLLRLTGNGDVSFKTYTVERDLTSIANAVTYMNLTVDVPQGSGAKVKNVEQAIRQIMAGSMLGEEVGAPIDGPLNEAVDNYAERFIEKVKTEGFGAVQCIMYISAEYQTKNSLVLHTYDGIYGNGGPQEYYSVVRLSDGHIMETEELIDVKPDMLKDIVKQYYDEDKEGIAIILDDGYGISPVSPDSCRILWAVNSHIFAEAIIPLSAVRNYLTDEGEQLFTSEAVEIKRSEWKNEETKASAEGTTTEDDEIGRGDLGIFDLRGPVKEVRVENTVFTFSESGEWLSRDGESLKTIYSGGIERDGNGRLVKGNTDPYGETYHEYTYNDKGLVTEINFQDYMDGGTIAKYTYDSDGHVATEILQPTGMDALDAEIEEYKYTILETDSHGNWTKRKDQNGKSTTRQITYY